MSELNRDDPELLHDQLATILRGQIERGELTGKLPAQLDLAKTYGVSRETVTKALAVLKSEGLVTAIRSRGTFATGQGREVTKMSKKSKKLTALTDPANDPVFTVVKRSARLPVDAFANKDGVFLASTNPEFITSVPRGSAAGKAILGYLKAQGRNTG
jgi:DNA-binding GntR family transcriptional regulator